MQWKVTTYTCQHTGKQLNASSIALRLLEITTTSVYKQHQYTLLIVLVSKEPTDSPPSHASPCQQ